MSKENLTSIKDDVLRWNYKYFENMLNQPYQLLDLTPMQKKYLLLGNCNIRILPYIFLIENENLNSLNNKFKELLEKEIYLRAYLDKESNIFNIHNISNELQLPTIDISHLESYEQKRYINNSINMLISDLENIFHSKYPFLYRFCFFKINKNKFYFLIIHNHLIFDGGFPYDIYFNYNYDRCKKIMNFSTKNIINNNTFIYSNKYIEKYAYNYLNNCFELENIYNKECDSYTILNKKFIVSCKRLVRQTTSNISYLLVILLGNSFCKCFNVSKLPICIIYTDRHNSNKEKYLINDYHKEAYILFHKNIIYEEICNQISIQKIYPKEFMTAYNISLENYYKKFNKIQDDLIVLNIVLGDSSNNEKELEEEILEFFQFSRQLKKTSVRQIACKIFVDIVSGELNISIKYNSKYSSVLKEIIDIIYSEVNNTINLIKTGK